MVGLARRRRPKPQARSAVSRADDDLFKFDVLFHRRGQAAKVGRLGDPSLPMIFDRRPRASREKGERLSLASRMRGLFYWARPCMALACTPSMWNPKIPGSALAVRQWSPWILTLSGFHPLREAHPAFQIFSKKSSPSFGKICATGIFL